jgi:hypothetical protein
MTATFWGFVTLPMTEVFLAALILQTLWFIFLATFTTVGARNEQRQFWKRRKNRKLEFTGILQSWIKRIATSPRAIFWSLFTLKHHWKHVRWRIYSNGKIRSKKALHTKFYDSNGFKNSCSNIRSFLQFGFLPNHAEQSCVKMSDKSCYDRFHFSTKVNISSNQRDWGYKGFRYFCRHSKMVFRRRQRKEV